MDLFELLNQDEKYNQLLATLSEEEKELLNSYMNSFMKQWQEELFIPLEEKSKDKDFLNELKKVINPK